MNDPGFVPGLELSGGFYAECVKPVMESDFASLPHSAALVGHGSEVLGFDTPMSTDHHWGPRVMLFLRPEEHGARREEIRRRLGARLPSTYRGYSTHYTAPDPRDHGVQKMAPHPGGPVNHRVELLTIPGYLRSYLGLDLSEPMTSSSWLSLPMQKLRSLVSGGVFHDDLGLEAVRSALAWYPEDVWLYLLGCLWYRIGQEEHLMGRAGSVGDEVGSAIIGSRLARDVMRIAFLLERQYPPYPKWFGTAFARLACAPALRPQLEAALHSRSWQEREAALCAAFEALLHIQHAAGIQDGQPDRASRFWGRPFLVIRGDRIAEAIFSRIADAGLAARARTRPFGSVDIASDSTDVLEDPSIRRRLQGLLGP